MKTVALVMIAKNEARCLKRCLSSMKPLVDEMILIDTGSTDSTKEIAASAGAKIYDYIWQNDFSAARNFALEKSSCDWNFVVDADEYLIKGSKKELLRFLNGAPAAGRIKRIDDYYEKDGISQSSSFIARVFPSSVRYTGKIHEQPETGSLPRVILPITLGHDGYLYQSKGERNLSILLQVLETEPKNPYYLFQTAHTLRLMKRHKEADRYYKQFYALAPRDYTYCSGALLSYLYNLLEMEDFEGGLALLKREESYFQSNTDYWFFCGTFYTKLVLSDTARYLQYLPEIEASYLKCLRLGESSQAEGVLGTGTFKAAYNLGVWYEVSGNTSQARQAYKKSASYGYEPAKTRLKNLH